jgi:hypothetical protein
MLTTKPRMVNTCWTQSPISLKQMSIWCPILDPHLPTHHSNIVVQINSYKNHHEKPLTLTTWSSKSWNDEVCINEFLGLFITQIAIHFCGEWIYNYTIHLSWRMLSMKSSQFWKHNALFWMPLFSSSIQYYGCIATSLLSRSHGALPMKKNKNK